MSGSDLPPEAPESARVVAMPTEAADAPVASPGHISTISDNSYRSYDGPLQTRAVRWWIVALATIRANVNKSRFGFWIPVGLIILCYLILGAVFYFTTAAREAFAARGLAAGDTPLNTYAATLYAAETNPFVSLLVFIAVLIVGAASIASDNRANALLVYLSKPLTRIDYLLGKWAGIFILIYGLVLVPSLLLFLFFATVYNSDGFLKDNPTLILRVLFASAIPALLQASLIVGFSAWSKSSRISGASYAAFYLVLGILVLRLGANLRDSERPGAKTIAVAVSYSSVSGVANAISQRIYAVDPQKAAELVFSGGRRKRHRKHPQAEGDATAPPAPDTPAPSADDSPTQPPLAFVLLLGTAYIVIPLAAAHFKVRAVEVVRG